MRDAHLWTDGSGTTVDTPGGWAYILKVLDSGELIEESVGAGRVLEGGTNNRMELTAAIEGLKQLRAGAKVTVHSDSGYVVKAFNEGWLARWRQRGWRGVKNIDLWERLEALEGARSVQWKWVKGHNGNFLNERCDRLASEQRRSAIEECRQRAIRGAPARA